jgi:hypothetical protein
MMPERRPQGIEKYLGKPLISGEGEKIGTIDRFIEQRLTGVPEWMVVEAGILGTKDFVVPVADSSLEEDGVHVPYPKEVIVEEPEIEVDAGITPEAETILNSYFGLGAQP